MDVKSLVASPVGGTVLLLIAAVVLWKLVPILAAIGLALVRFIFSLFFALLALGFFGFLAFGMIRTIFHPFFGK